MKEKKKENHNIYKPTNKGTQKVNGQPVKNTTLRVVKKGA